MMSHPWLALGATSSVQTLATMALGAVAVLAPAVAPQLGLAPERVGWFIGAAYLVAMLSGLVLGPWVNRLGGTRMSQGVMLAVAIGAAVATGGAPWLLMLAAVLLGLGYGVANPASAAILGRHAPRASAGLFFALKQSGVPIGVALAGVLMPLGLAAIGWQATAWATAAVCLLGAALLGPAAAHLDPPQKGFAPCGAAWAHALAAVLRQPLLRRLSLVSLVYAMAQHGFLTFSVSLLTLKLGLPLAVAAGLLAVSQVACTIARIGLGHVGDRWVDPRVVLGVLGLCMAASCLALAWLPPSPPVALAALVMIACGATTMGWNGVYFAQLARSVPREEIAASAGGTQFFTFAGSMLGPVLFAQLLGLGGSYAAGYVGLAVLGAAAGLGMLLPVPRAAALRPARQEG